MEKNFPIKNIESKKEKRNYFFHLAWPAAAEGILIHLLSSIDLIMAGSLGSQAQAAIGIISQPKMMTLLFVRAFATALTAVISRRYGEKNSREMNAIFKQSLVVTSIFYFILIGLCLAIFPKILGLAGAQKDYWDSAYTYGTIIFIGLFFNAIAMIINASLVAVGQTRVIFVANVAGNIVNCLLNYCFIFGAFGFPRLGILGIGIGTLTGNILSLFISAKAVANEKIPLSFKEGEWMPKREKFTSIIKVLQGSLPEQFFERLGMFLYTVMVAHLGLIYMAVHHIAMNLCDVLYSMAIGLGTATAATTGQMLGKKSPEEAYEYGKIGERFGLLVAGIGFCLFFFFRQDIVSLFSKDPQVIEIGSKIMIIVAVVSFPQTLSLVHSGVLKGAGDTKYVAHYSFLIIAIMRPLLTYILLFKLDLGLTGAWIALLCDQSLRALAATRRFYSKKWQKVNL